MRNPYRPLCAVLPAALAFVLLSGQAVKKPSGLLIGRELLLEDAKGPTPASRTTGLAFWLNHRTGAQLAVLGSTPAPGPGCHHAQGRRERWRDAGVARTLSTETGT